MSDTSDHEQLDLQPAVEYESAVVAPVDAAPSSAVGGFAPTASMCALAQRTPGPAGASFPASRAQRSAAPTRPIASSPSRQSGIVRRAERSHRVPADAGPNVRRVQRSHHVGSHPTAPARRVQRQTGRPIVQRDLVDTLGSIGDGIASTARAMGSKAVDGVKALGNAAIDGARAVGDFAVGTARKIHRSDFDDLNATQYLVTAGGVIEAIDRRVEDGEVVYYRTGSVTPGDGERPVVEPYEQAIPMPPGWLPTVTHINGMMVKPNEGLGSALRLQQELENAGGQALLTADVPAVLYTYSAHRGFVTDLAECVWGKLYQDDDATDRQTQIMLDAVAGQHRTTVSAHSRGTIKTDNAVRNAHAQISAGFVEAASADPALHQRAAELAEMAARLQDGPGLSASMLEPMYRRLLARERADELATIELDRYVQLIYAGNAVQFPSNSVNLKLVVAGSDPVTIGVGKYFRFAKGSKTEMTDVEGGHGFDDNYAATVAGLIIADLEAQQ